MFVLMFGVHVCKWSVNFKKDFNKRKISLNFSNDVLVYIPLYETCNVVKVLN